MHLTTVSSVAGASEGERTTSPSYSYSSLPCATIKLPILGWLPQYDAKECLLDDVSAGLTTFVYLVPQAMAYATIVGMPAVYGLYSSVLPLVVYAVFGTSRQLSMAPMAITSLLLGAAVRRFHYADDSPELIAVALSVTLITGVILLLMGLCRLGALASFISPNVLLGFLTASGIIIGVVQIKDILGIVVPRFPRLYQTVIYTLQHLNEVKIAPMVLGGTTWAVLFAIREWRKKRNARVAQNEKEVEAANRTNERGSVCNSNSLLRCLAQLANFFAVVIGSAIAAALISNGISLHVVGEVPSGFTTPKLRPRSLTELVDILPAATTLAFVSFAGNWSLCKKYSELYRYEVDASQELIAYGVAVISGALTNSFMVAGGLGRTVVNADAGARSQVSSMITATLVALSLLLFTGLFYFIPLCILSAIIQVALASMVDFPAFLRIYRRSCKDFLVVLGTFFATLLIGEAEGLLLGIMLDIVIVLYGMAYPPIYILGKTKGSSRIYEDVFKYPSAQQLPGVVIARVDGNLFYANCNYVRDFICKATEKEQHPHGVAIERVVFDCSAWTDIDTAAVDMLSKLQSSLAQRSDGGVILLFCAVRENVCAALQHLKFCYSNAVEGECEFIAVDIEAAITMHIPRIALRSAVDKEMVAMTNGSSPNSVVEGTGAHQIDQNTKNDAAKFVRAPFHFLRQKQYLRLEGSEHGYCEYKQMQDEDSALGRNT